MSDSRLELELRRQYILITPLLREHEREKHIQETQLVQNNNFTLQPLVWLNVRKHSLTTEKTGKVGRLIEIPDLRIVMCVVWHYIPH